ncbi:MAG: hypothetical protein U0R27_13945 [Candidatus Nanopelagicales bacterium]
MREPVIAASAHRHGMSDDNIRHAYRNAILAHGPDEEGLIMLVGPAYDGSLAEVGLVESSDGVRVVVHAMSPARARFLR